MIYIIADNITSPLGATTQENLEAVLQGQSALRRHEGLWGIPTAVCASLFSREQTARMAREGLTRFEAMAVSSARKAMSRCKIDVASGRTLFVLSTTKGNIELLGTDGEKRISPAEAAEHIARALGFKDETLTVCNACISGVSAMITAERLLEAGCYENAVVTGADVACRFTVSGFQALKAVSEDACRPFDLERLGLNLGEAAATVVLSRKAPEGAPALWALEVGAVNNDAHHITSPSPRAEGASAALRAVAAEGIALINAHGTATMFNDQMESFAIAGCGFGDVPVNALKGYTGHTLGAAGILETVLTAAALERGFILPTKGYGERGVSGRIDVVSALRKTDGRRFVKMISGFGGGNAALSLVRTEAKDAPAEKKAPDFVRTHSVEITPERVRVDGREIACEGEGLARLTALYKQHIASYPKYYKMDPLARLGFVASELLLQAEGKERREEDATRAVVLCNSSSSIMADRAYETTIGEGGNYYPSPSAFIYTLPNIVTGEIALRNGYRGETGFCIMPGKDEALIDRIIGATLLDRRLDSLIAGWIDCTDDTHYEASIYIIESNK